MKKKNVTDGFDIANSIPVGHGNAVSRKYLASVTGMSDRMVRKAIECSEKPIINLGYGYFIPDMADAVDRSEVAAYCAQERARVRTIEEKLENKFAGFENDMDDAEERETA